MTDDRRQPYQSTSRCRLRTGWDSGNGPHKRGLNTKIHLAVDAHSMSVRFFITSGATADYTIAAQLIEGFRAEYLLADLDYDTDIINLKAVDKGMIPVIPTRKNRKHLWEYDKYLYKLHHLVENAFSCFSKDGAVLRRATQKILRLSLLLFKSAVLLFGSSFIGDTI